MAGHRIHGVTTTVEDESVSFETRPTTTTSINGIALDGTKYPGYGSVEQASPNLMFTQSLGTYTMTASQRYSLCVSSMGIRHWMWLVVSIIIVLSFSSISHFHVRVTRREEEISLSNFLKVRHDDFIHMYGSYNKTIRGDQFESLDLQANCNSGIVMDKTDECRLYNDHWVCSGKRGVKFVYLHANPICDDEIVDDAAATHNRTNGTNGEN